MNHTPSVRALRIEPARTELVRIDTLRLAVADRAGIMNTGYRSSTLSPEIAMLIDHSAHETGEPLNAWATLVTHAVTTPTSPATIVFGTVLVFGIDSATGMRAVRGLNDEQLRQLAGIVAGPPAEELVERLELSLERLPGALDYVANILRLPVRQTQDARSADEASATAVL